jgi:hypothetical protein
MNQDLEHLRLLSIFHYVVGGLAALFACFPCIHLTIGIALVSGAMPAGPGQEGPPAMVGWFFIAIATAMILVGWSVAIAILVAGKFLSQKSHYMYCLVVAAIECLFMPFGTVLGVFTIIVLIRPSVKPLFETPRDEMATT